MPTPSAAEKLSPILNLDYSWEEGHRDLIAGLTVAAISLPEGMAYAVIAGVDPRFGLYSSIVLTMIAAIFGSSSHLITAATSAISLVVFSVLAFFDPDDSVEAVQALFLIGVMVGTIQIFIAVFRLGDLTRYISESVILGFMVGAAVVLAISQVANFLGVRARGTGHQNILHRLWLTLTEGYPFNLKAIAISTATVALVLILRKVFRAYRLPHLEMLAVLVLVAAAAFFLGWSQPDAGGKTAIAVAGSVPASLPSPHIPEIKFAWVSDFASSALAIALLGLLEALAAAKSIASQSGQPIDYNRLCLSQGIANLVGGFFRCLPGSGSLSRSAINFQAGAATRMSGIFTALAVAVALLFIAPLIRYIPKAALAGLLVLTAAGLIDLQRVSYAFRASRYDAGLVLITALTAIFVGVEYSILVGVALSILLFVPRASKLKAAELVVSPERVVRGRLPTDPPCTAIILFDLEGEFFFGAAPELDHYLDELNRRAVAQGIRFIVLRLKRIRNPDAVCLERIDHFLHAAKKLGLTVLLAGVRPDLLAAIKSLKFQDWYPADNIFPDEGDDADSATLKAVRRAYELLGEANTCAHCAKSVGGENREECLYYLV
jgi:SulP family sulfate permease